MNLAEGIKRPRPLGEAAPAPRGEDTGMTLTAAQTAARRDHARQMFVVYTDSGQSVVTTTRDLAVTLARRTNGSWSRVPR